MSTKRWWVTILVGILILAVLAGAGYAVYRLGYAQGAQATSIDQSAPRNYQELPNLRHFAPGSRGFERGITPFTQMGRVAGMGWMGIITRLAIPALAIIALVLLIVFLFGKLGSSRTPQKAPVAFPANTDDQKHGEL